MALVRDYGNWVKDPSGAKKGDLKAWRENMFKLCPFPEIGDVVVAINSGKVKEYGYRCVQPDGFDTVWERVRYDGDLNVTENIKHGVYVNGLLVEITPENRPFVTETASGIPCTSEGVYLADGVYIDPEDCWF